LFGEPGLDKGLVRHIALVRLDLDTFEQRKRQSIGRLSIDLKTSMTVEFGVAAEISSKKSRSGRTPI
jgi:hypothetical protein